MKVVLVQVVRALVFVQVVRALELVLVQKLEQRRVAGVCCACDVRSVVSCTAELGCSSDEVQTSAAPSTA